MATLQPNPLASPASQPQPNVSNQYTQQTGIPMTLRPPRGRGTAADPMNAAATAIPNVSAPVGGVAPIANTMGAQGVNPNASPTPAPASGPYGAIGGLNGSATPTSNWQQAHDYWTQRAAQETAGGVPGQTSSTLRAPTPRTAYAPPPPRPAAGNSYGMAATNGTNAGAVRVGGIRPPSARRLMPT